jgi:ribosomal protein S12 methylthiotransferase accessory factor YcaO
VVGGGEENRLQLRVDVAGGSVRQEIVVAIGPQMRVERVDPFVGRGLHHDPPAALVRSLQELRQHALERLVLQMVEQDFGHRS